MQVVSKNSVVRRLPTPWLAGLGLAGAVLFTACGQKGPLRLVTEPAAAPTASAAASAPAR